MIRISVKNDLDRMRTLLTDFERKQLPFASALALTRLAGRAREDLKSEMSSAFDRPTPFTMNSLALKPATKSNLEAKVGFKDWAPKGVPAGRYLRAQIEGGPRTDKSSERKLRAAGVLPGGYFMMPARGARKNGYGNVSPGHVVKVLSAVGALSTAGSAGNRSGRGRGKRRNENYFVVQPGARNGLPPGIYRRTPQGGHILDFIFTKQPKYAPRFRFGPVAQDSYQRNAPGEFAKALRDAFRMARRR